jgi:hypothetical protein
LVDPLDAVGRGRGAYRDRRPNGVELEVVSISPTWTTSMTFWALPVLATPCVLTV